MLHDLIASSSYGESTLVWIEYASLVIELLAVAIIVITVIYGVFHYIFQGIFNPENEERYRDLKERLGRSLSLGLEILVAADIIRTVALEATLASVAVLGLLVLIRTFLSWSLVVELEGHWPWHSPARSDQGNELIE